MLVHKTLAIGFWIAVFLFLGAIVLPGFFPSSRDVINNVPASVDTTEITFTPTVIAGTNHVPLPPEVRGIYWHAGTAGRARADELLAYMEETGLNSTIIDVKIENGGLAFVPVEKSLQAYQAQDVWIEDIDGLLEKLGDRGIYRIARISVFRDRVFADAHPKVALRTAGGGLWHDRIGASYVDPAAPEVAEYAIALGREAYARGFDEIQYDYVRFPSDGNIRSIVYPVYDGNTPKEQVMCHFFATVGGTLKQEGIPVSFDLFGMTYWREDDFNIGQRLADAYPYADFISPMLYPSHFPEGFEGFKNPAAFPYEIVKSSIDSGAALMEKNGFDAQEVRRKTRVWIQDFDIGADYSSDKIEAQIRGARDAGASGWMLWNARNVYTEAKYLVE